MSREFRGDVRGAGHWACSDTKVIIDDSGWVYVEGEGRWLPPHRFAHINPYEDE